MVMSVFATRCDTAAAWLLATWSSGRTSVAGADAAPVLLSGSATGPLSRAVSRWHAETMVTRATMVAIRMVVGRDACTCVRRRSGVRNSRPARAEYKDQTASARL